MNGQGGQTKGGKSTHSINAGRFSRRARWIAAGVSAGVFRDGSPISIHSWGASLRAALCRKRWRKPVKRAAFLAVVLITNFSLLVTQTQAYLEIERQIHMPQRVALAASTWNYVSAAAASAVTDFLLALRGAALGLLPDGQEVTTTLSPAGRPHPWQTAVPAAPFTIANMATGNLLTEVPIVSWQPLGRPMSFSLFHNTLGVETGQEGVLLSKWTHSYSRHLVYDEGDNAYTFYPDEGGSVLLTPRPGQPNNYIPPAGFHMTLQRGEEWVVLTYKNQDQDVFERATGRLKWLEDASGNFCWMTYQNGGQRLSKITDASDNELTLGYDESGRLTSVTAPQIGSGASAKDRCYDIAYEIPGEPGSPKVLKVSTARRNEGGEPLFWAKFHVQEEQGSRLVQIDDYSVGFDEDGNPLPGAASTITYRADGRVHVVTLASGRPEQLTRTFDFLNYPVRYPLPPIPIEPEDPPGQGFREETIIDVTYPVVKRATVRGSRTAPGPDITT